MTTTDLGSVPQKAEALETEIEETQQLEENEGSDSEEAGQDDEQDGHGASDDEAGSESEDGEEQAITPEEQRQEIQERLIEQDTKAAQVRANLKEDWEDIEKAHDLIKTQIQNPVPLNGKPAYLASDEEFEAAEDAILDSGDAGLLAALKQAKKERREYLKKAQALAPKFQKVQQERTRQTLEDIEQIKGALKEISPEYQKYFNELENTLKEEFEANPAKLERFVWGGIRDKFRYIDRLLDESGIKQRVEKEINAKLKPNLAAPVGAGKGRRNSPTGTPSKKIYTRAEIAAMSPQQYEKLEKELDKAMLEGRIK